MGARREAPAAAAATQETPRARLPPAADPLAAGPFKVITEKNVRPKAGAVPDSIYGDKQQSFNIYRPDSLKDYCHPIMIWANGYKDSPKQNPPHCIVDSTANRWCGQYSPLLIHLASHGFVVMASFSFALTAV